MGKVDSAVLCTRTPIHSISERNIQEKSRKRAMEWDQRDREPCLSPAAFVNQVQYSNILEGRFKQLQGKSHTDLVPFHLGILNIHLSSFACLG